MPDPDPRRRPGGPAWSTSRCRSPAAASAGDDGTSGPRQGARRCRWCSASPTAPPGAAPDAWIVDLTNPVGSSRRACSARVTAPSASATRRWCSSHLAKVLEVAPERVGLDHLGLNLPTWEPSVRLDGEEIPLRPRRARGPSCPLPRTPAPSSCVASGRCRRTTSYFYGHDHKVEEQRARSRVPRSCRRSSRSSSPVRRRGAGGKPELLKRAAAPATRGGGRAREPVGDAGRQARRQPPQPGGALPFLADGCVGGARPVSMAQVAANRLPRSRPRSRAVWSRITAYGDPVLQAALHAGASGSSRRCSPIRSSARLGSRTISRTDARREQGLPPWRSPRRRIGGNSRRTSFSPRATASPRVRSRPWQQLARPRRVRTRRSTSSARLSSGCRSIRRPGACLLPLAAGMFRPTSGAFGSRPGTGLGAGRDGRQRHVRRSCRPATDRADAVAVICGSGINCVGAAPREPWRGPGAQGETGIGAGVGRSAARRSPTRTAAARGRGEPDRARRRARAPLREAGRRGRDHAVHYGDPWTRRTSARSHRRSLDAAARRRRRRGRARAAARERDRHARRACAARARPRRRRRRPRGGCWPAAATSSSGAFASSRSHPWRGAAAGRGGGARSGRRGRPRPLSRRLPKLDAPGDEAHDFGDRRGARPRPAESSRPARGCSAARAAAACSPPTCPLDSR